MVECFSWINLLLLTFIKALQFYREQSMAFGCVILCSRIGGFFKCQSLYVMHFYCTKLKSKEHSGFLQLQQIIYLLHNKQIYEQQLLSRCMSNKYWYDSMIKR